MINTRLIRLINKKYSLVFLVFLTFFLQKIIILKVFGVLIIYFFYPFVLKYKNEFTLKFYLAILYFSILNGALYLNKHGYFIALFLVVIFWILCYLSTKQVYYFVKNSTLEDIMAIVHLFFFINMFFWLINYLKAMKYYHHIFPFIRYNSAGDFMLSIYANSSIAMIIFSFFVIFFATYKKYFLSVAALLMLLSTTYMSGIIIFVGSIIAYAIFLAKRSLSNRLFLIIILPLCLLMFVKTVIPTNYEYAKSYCMDSIVNKPRKIISFYQTFDYISGSIKNLLIGAGPGNFSSRVAFTATGEYVSWFPHKFRYINKDFLINHLSLWNPYILKKEHNKGTANQPFSIYNQLLGEYGMVGMLLFLNFYAFVLFRRAKNSVGVYLILLLLAYGILDYWFEYFSVIPIFEFIFLAQQVKVNVDPSLHSYQTISRPFLNLNRTN